jgi:hypothetical protein
LERIGQLLEFEVRRFHGTSVVVWKFSSFPPRVRQENFRTKTALESLVSSSNPKFAEAPAARRM